MKLITVLAAGYAHEPGVGGHAEVYKDDAGEWRWRRVAGNSQIVGTSHDGYDERNDCVEIAARLWGQKLPYYDAED